MRNLETFCSMDVDLVKTELERFGIAVEVRTFSEIDVRRCDVVGRPVIYQSSEDEGLLYKSFIEDVLLALQFRGACLVPSFYCFRSHHNKVFWELLRDAVSSEEVKSIQSRCYGVLEEFLPGGVEYPQVIKASEGAGSRGVHLAHNAAEAARKCEEITLSANWRERLSERLSRKRIPGYVKRSLHRRKFVVQNFIGGLTHDYKVLAYGKKYYVVRRDNRPGDFRASGSGLLSWPEEPPQGLLDFASKVFGAFDAPAMSMDIAHDGEHFHLIEGQFVCFGPKSLQDSSHYFTPAEPGWRRVVEPSVLEEEFARCVAAYLEREQGGEPASTVGPTT